MKKLLFIIGLIVLLVASGIGLRSCGFGFGWGGGSGNGGGSNPTSENTNDTEGSSESTSEVTPNIPEPQETEEPKDEKENEIYIVVKQDTYYIEDEEVTINRIKSILSEMEDCNVVIENNYASKKAWDDIKKLLSELEIVAVEK